MISKKLSVSLGSAFQKKVGVKRRGRGADAEKGITKWSLPDTVALRLANSFLSCTESIKTYHRTLLEKVSFYKSRWGRLCEGPSPSLHQPVDNHAHRPLSFSRTAPLPRTRFISGTLGSSPHSFTLACPPLLHQHRLLSKVCKASELAERWPATPTQFFYGPQCKVELKGKGACCF